MRRDPGKGFANPVFDAQSVFRAAQDALARPGIVQAMPCEALTPPEGFCLAAAAMLLTLADYATPVWLTGGLAHPSAYWLSFHTGAPVVDDPALAQFAHLPVGAEMPLLSAFSQGEECYPDRSATLLIECAAFSGGAPVRLSGPGIKDAVEIAPCGLRCGFWVEMIRNAAQFPLGVDVLLLAGRAVIGLPRSTKIAEVACISQ